MGRINNDIDALQKEYNKDWTIPGDDAQRMADELGDDKQADIQR